MFIISVFCFPFLELQVVGQNRIPFLRCNEILNNRNGVVSFRSSDSDSRCYVLLSGTTRDKKNYRTVQCGVQTLQRDVAQVPNQMQSKQRHRHRHQEQAGMQADNPRSRQKPVSRKPPIQPRRTAVHLQPPHVDSSLSFLARVPRVYSSQHIGILEILVINNNKRNRRLHSARGMKTEQNKC